MKLCAKLTLVIAVICACGSANAEKFNNWPTYASAPLTNWPKASEYDNLVEDLTWCHDALTERSEVVSESTTGIAPAANSVRTPKADVERFKDQMETLIPQYVNHDQSGSFTNLSEFPMLTVTGTLADLSLPADFLDNTPYSRCLANTLPPGVTTNYGIPGVKDAILKLKWTKRFFMYSDRGNAATNRYKRTGSAAYRNTFALAEAEVEDEYDEGWTEGGIFFYQFSRYASHSSYWPSGWNAGVTRLKSTPQCPGITAPDNVQFSWEAYLEPYSMDNDCGVAYDGYSGWVEGKLKLWDTGGPVSSNLVRATTIGGQDQTFPFDLAPELTQSTYTTNGVNITVRDFHWLLKWDFQL